MTEQPYNLGRAAALAAAVLLAAAVPLGIAWTLGLHRQQAALAGGELAREAQPGSTLASDLEQQLKRLERTIVFDWIGVGAAAAGAALLALALQNGKRGTRNPERGTDGEATSRDGAARFGVQVPSSPLFAPSSGFRVPRFPFWVAAAAAPAACAVLCAAPEAVSQESVPVARLAVLVGAAVAWIIASSKFQVPSSKLKTATQKGPFTWNLELETWNSYAVCGACLAVAALFFTWWEPPPPKAVPIARPLALLEKELMAQLPGWTGAARRMPKAIEGQVGADEYLNLDLTPPAGAKSVTVYITYNANAMSQIPHVPWVCMTQAGYQLVEIRQDGVAIAGVAGREIQPNVILFEGGSGRERARALMFQYFRVGETYTWSRQLARFLATTGSLGGAGSFLSQTQVAVWLAPAEGGDPLDKNSPAYRLGLQVLELLVPLLERGYYPDLKRPGGG